MKEFNILVVDDEDEFREIMLKRLQKHGLQAKEAENGQKALDILAHSHTDVVLLDYKMPGMDGIEPLRRLKTLKPLVEVRSRLAEELARRENRDPLVPIDRDPVPNRYTELVRRYYEELGKDR